MALITSIKNLYSSGNPIEIHYNHTGTDAYCKFVLLDGATELFTGVYYPDSNDVLFVDIAQILYGLVDTKQFNINSSTLYTEMTNALKSFTLQIYRSSAGVYTLDVTSTINLMPQSLTNSQFLDNFAGNSFGSYDDALSPLNGNNLILNGFGRAAAVGSAIQQSITGLDNLSPVYDYFDLTFNSNDTTWIKTVAAGTASTYAIYIRNDWFKEGDDLYFNFDFSFTGGQPLTIEIYLRDAIYTETLMSTHILSADTAAFRHFSLKSTVTERDCSSFVIKFIFSAANVLNSTFKTKNFYFGNNPLGYLPTVAQVSYMGQDIATRIGTVQNPAYKAQDFILNQFNQYFPSVSIDADVLRSKINENIFKDTLRYAPAAFQTYSYSTTDREYGNIQAHYIIDDTFGLGTIPVTLLLDYFTPTIGRYKTVGNIRFDVQASPSFNTSMFDATKYIILQVNRYAESANPLSLSPTYGRELRFKLIDAECLKGNAYQLYYLNRRGGVDWIVMTGNNIYTENNTSSTYKSKWRTGNASTIFGDLATIVKPKYNIDIASSYTLNSDILNDFDYNQLNDLVSSPKLWLYDAQSNDTYAVEVTDTNFVGKQRRFDKMFNFTVTVSRQLNNIRNQF